MTLSAAQPQLFIVRGGARELLKFADYEHVASVSITETEPVEFVLVDKMRYESRPRLWIGDASIEPSEVRTADVFTEYRWYPHQKPSFFLNHFGTSRIVLELHEQSGETRTFQTFVEVYARKFNAEQVELLLQYLERHFDDIVKSCFSLTTQGSGTDQKLGGFRHARVLMEEARYGLDLLQASLVRLRQKKRSRLTPQPSLRSWSQVGYVGEYATHWLTNHLDTLVPSPGNARAVAIGNRRYTPQVIETEELVEDTDVYENQIIHGYLVDVAAKLQQIEAYYQEQLEFMWELETPTDIPIGYQSFNIIRREFGQAYCERLLTQCRALQSLCRYCQHQLQEVVPVHRPLRESPKLTSGFHSYPHYRSLFERIRAWYALGGLDRRLDRFLLGLRTIDKLYEFFCLFKLVEAVTSAGFEKQEATHLSSENASLMAIENPYDKYVFSNRNNQWATLYYEPNLSRANSDVDGLIDVKHGSYQKYPYRPDFVLECRGSNSYQYIVLDAKYKNPNSWGDELPSMALKYLHGLGSVNGGFPSTQALILLYPKQSGGAGDSWNRYHSEEYDLFSNQPAKPVLGAISLSLQDSNNVSADLTLTEIVTRLVSLVRQ